MGKGPGVIDCDVVVVGAGLAGLVAANRAAELGLRVTVLEQGTSEDYACNTRIATGAVNFAHGEVELPPDQLARAVADETEGHADPVLATALAAVGGRGLKWLQTEGAEFIQREVQGKRSRLLAPLRLMQPGLDWRNRGPDVVLRRLGQNLRNRGGQLVLGARAASLSAEAGRCVGLKATTESSILEFKSGDVVLADGGFQANPDLVRKYMCKRAEALVQRSAGSGNGDAVRMAEAVGAKLVDMERFYGHLLSRAATENARLWPYPTLDGLTGGSILIDRSGRRIFDEGLGGIALSNRIAGLDDPLCMTIVFDEEIWNTAGLDEVVPPNPHLVGAGGILHRAPDLDSLAALIDIPAPNLRATIATYNRALREGRPDGLDPPRTPGRRFAVRRGSPDRIAPRPIERPPFYAAPLSVGISCTMGGIAIDRFARALDRDDAPIPGLYAVGSTTGGLEGGPNAGYIGGLAKAYCLGLIAAEHIGFTRSAE